MNIVHLGRAVLDRPWLASIKGNPPFTRFWFAHTISAIGDSVHFVAFPWLFLEITDSPGKLSAMAILNFLPVLIFGVIAGVIIDRYSRRNLLVITNGLAMLGVISVPIAYWLGTLSELHLYVATFAVGTLRVFVENGAVAFVPEIVPRPSLLPANSALQVGHSSATVVGPIIGGLIIAGAGSALAVSTYGIALALAALIILTVPGRPRPTTSARPLASLIEGLRHLVGEKVVLAMAVMLLFVNLCITPCTTLLFYRLKTELAVDPSIVGTIVSAGGAGAIVGAIIARVLGNRRREMMFTNVLFGIGIGLAAIGFMTSPFMLGAAWFLVVMSISMTIILHTTLRQEMVPQAILGRVGAAFRTISLLAVPVGIAVGGTIAEVTGTTIVFYGAGAIVLATALIGRQVMQRLTAV